MRTKRSYEGVLLIDHRVSPGVPDQMMPAGMPLGSGHGLFEAPIYTCSHCQKQVVVNPLRNRSRAWCRYCDHYICDPCGGILHTTGICKTYKQFMDELQEQGLKLTEE